MRKRFAIACGLALLIPFLLRHLGFYLAERQAGLLFEQRLHSGEAYDGLVRFAFSRSDAGQLDWEHEREFVYRGQMYDVVHRIEKPDSLLLWCWPDAFESECYQLFARKRPGESIPQQAHAQWTRFLQSLFPAPQPPALEARPVELLRRLPFRPFFVLQDVSSPPPVPPPEAGAGIS